MHQPEHRYYRLHKRDWKLFTQAIYVVRALRVIVCIPLLTQILATKCPKTVTAAYLSINNSKTKAVSSFSQAYFSEGVLLLAVDIRERVAKLLR